MVASEVTGNSWDCSGGWGWVNALGSPRQRGQVGWYPCGVGAAGRDDAQTCTHLGQVNQVNDFSRVYTQL